MADIIDQEAKRRGIDRATMMAFYQRQMEMRGQNGTGGQTTAQRPAAPRPNPDQRGPLQRLLDALGGNPSGH